MQPACQIKTTCPYCGVGCGVEATVDTQSNHIIAVSGDTSHPANFGKLCVKGSALHETMGEQGRLTHPMVAGKKTDWSSAIEAVADRLSEVRDQYGPQAIAFYLSGQILTEDYYVANKLAKGFIGTGHVDTNSRLCMSSAVAAYKRAFGSDTVPCDYQDLECCDLLVLTGSNAAWTHPVLYRRMVKAKQDNPNLKVVVIDPRRTATCDLADLHLAIAPGSDNFIFSGLLHYLSANGLTDKAYIDKHTQGFAKALESVAMATLDDVSQTAQISSQDLQTFYQWFAETEKAITFYSQGINQSATGTDKCNAIINCHLATGKLGKAGMGPFSITGQPNAMGGREVGGLANMLAAHMDYSEQTLSIVSEFWNSPSLCQQPGLKAIELFDAMAEGQIKAIWIMGTNPVDSLPNADKVKAALENCETVIVSDCIAETDTTLTADILLPATGWGEKDGTVTNSERRISRQRSLLKAPQEARHDWWIMTQVACAMGYREAFAYTSPRDIFIEHAALSAFKNNGTRLFNIGGLSNLSQAQYDQLQPVQWPILGDGTESDQRVFSEGKFLTPSGKAQFIASVPELPKGKTCDQFPLALNTGRIRDQWHTMTRTARASRLLDHIDQPFVAIHPDTAKDFGLKDQDLAKVTTAYGYVQLCVVFDTGLKPNQLFIPIHWNNQFASKARVDCLVAPNIDPISGQPEFKFTAATLEKVEAPRWATIVSRNKLDCQSFINWSLSPLANDQGFLYLVAIDKSFNWQDFIALKRLTEQGPRQAYEQFSKGSDFDERFICYSDKQIEMAIFSHEEKDSLPSRGWLQGLFEQQVNGNYWSLISNSSDADQGKLICTCFKVSEDAIIAAIEDGASSAEELGRQLKCGTNCGSCVPELNQLINQTHCLV